MTTSLEHLNPGDQVTLVYKRGMGGGRDSKRLVEVEAVYPHGVKTRTFTHDGFAIMVSNMYFDAQGERLGNGIGGYAIEPPSQEALDEQTRFALIESLSDSNWADYNLKELKAAYKALRGRDWDDWE